MSILDNVAEFLKGKEKPKTYVITLPDSQPFKPNQQLTEADRKSRFPIDSGITYVVGRQPANPENQKEIEKKAHLNLKSLIFLSSPNPIPDMSREQMEFTHSQNEQTATIINTGKGDIVCYTLYDEANSLPGAVIKPGERKTVSDNGLTILLPGDESHVVRLDVAGSLTGWRSAEDFQKYNVARNKNEDDTEEIPEGYRILRPPKPL